MTRLNSAPESPCRQSRKRSLNSNQDYPPHSPVKKFPSEIGAKDIRKPTWAPRRPTCILCLKFFGTFDKAGCCSKCYANKLSEATNSRARPEPALAGIDPNAMCNTTLGVNVHSVRDALSDKSEMELD